MEAFDPLLVDDQDLEEDMPDNETIYSDSSFYESYDPFEYMEDKRQRQLDEEEHIYSTIPGTVRSTYRRPFLPVKQSVKSIHQYYFCFSEKSCHYL